MTAIDRLMTQKGISNEFMAYKCGVTTNTVKNWRAGRVRMFAEQALIAADVCDCEVEQLIEAKQVAVA